MCLVYSCDIILMLITMLICYILYKKKLYSYYSRLFFIVGSLCAYLGYWAFPLITLAMPLIFITGIFQKNESKNLFLFIVKQSVMWGIGLGSTVAAKIILSICVLNDWSGVSRLLFRLGTEMSLSERVIKLYDFIMDEFFSQTILILLTALSISGLAYIVRYLDAFWRKLLPYLMCAAYPFIWALATIGHIGHGFDHVYFCIFYYALALFVCQNIDIKKIILFYNKRDIYILFGYAISIILLFSFSIHYKMKVISPYAMTTISEMPIGKGVTQEFQLLDKREKYLNSIQAIFVFNKNERGIISINLMDGGKTIKEIVLPIASIISEEWTKIPINTYIFPDHSYTVKYTIEDQNSQFAILTEKANEANPFNGDCFAEQKITDKVVNIYEYQAVINTATKLYFSVITLFLIQTIQSFFIKKSTFR